MTTSRLQIARPDIVDFFDKAQTRILRHRNIEVALSSNRKFWRLNASTTARNFISFLLENTPLERVELNFPNQKVVRYLWGDISPHELGASLFPGGYLTHFSAIYQHGLTDQVPTVVYANTEQEPKGWRPALLEQHRIDWAFSRPQRVSRRTAVYKDHSICLLNGMYTGQLGVIELATSSGEKLRLTNVERTLIDITVRPGYAGGVYHVLEVYRAAHDRVSINKLSAMLKQLNYVYPYFQAVGFYLERAGVYRPTQIDLLRKYDMKYDFYLAHQMKEPEYSKEWRLYYPKGF